MQLTRTHGWREPLLDWLPLVLYLGASAVAFARWGPPFRNDWTWTWVLGGLLVASLRQLRRFLRGLFVDWLPFVLALIAYDIVRGVSDTALATTPHALPQIDVDRFLFLGHIPTVVLQRALYVPGHLHWWDYGVWAFYTTHYIVTAVVAAALWRLRPERFRLFRTMVVALAFAAVATYALYPSVPPWMAGLHGQIAEVHRIPLHAAKHLGIRPIGALFERGVRASNLVAAVPSLHAAFPMLLLLFFWSSGRWARLGMGVYTLLMAFSLVYGGEHYVSDVLAGWAYAVAIFWVVLDGLPRLGQLRPAPTFAQSSPVVVPPADEPAEEAQPLH
jgi:membrane-associated phospholipid phosphatase